MSLLVGQRVILVHMHACVNGAAECACHRGPLQMGVLGTSIVKTDGSLCDGQVVRVTQRTIGGPYTYTSIEVNLTCNTSFTPWCKWYKDCAEWYYRPTPGESLPHVLCMRSVPWMYPVQSPSFRIPYVSVAPCTLCFALRAGLGCACWRDAKSNTTNARTPTHPHPTGTEHRICVPCARRCWKGFVLYGTCNQTATTQCLKVGRDISPEEAKKWPNGTVNPSG